MARLAHLAWTATVFVVAGALPVRADPIHITITSGSMLATARPEEGSLDLAGTHGFMVTGAMSQNLSLLGVFGHCYAPECTPGTPLDVGLDFTSQSEEVSIPSMTLDGNRYDDISTPDAEAAFDMTFTASVLAPQAGPPRVTLTAPFAFSGNVYTEGMLEGILQGHGTTTVTLVPYNPAAGVPPAWSVDSLRFDFEQPTPEPSSLLLLGTAGIGIITRARRRKPDVREC